MSVVIDGSNGVDIGAGNLTFPDNTTQNSSPIGVGQTWQSFAVTGGSPTRVLGTTYTNNTGKPIMVNIQFTQSGTNINTAVVVGGVSIAPNLGQAASSGYFGISFIVPNNTTYITSGSNPLYNWAELR